MDGYCHALLSPTGWSLYAKRHRPWSRKGSASWKWFNLYRTVKKCVTSVLVRRLADYHNLNSKVTRWLMSLWTHSLLVSFCCVLNSCIFCSDATATLWSNEDMLWKLTLLLGGGGLVNVWGFKEFHPSSCLQLMDVIYTSSSILMKALN